MVQADPLAVHCFCKLAREAQVPTLNKLQIPIATTQHQATKQTQLDYQQSLTPSNAPLHTAAIAFINVPMSVTVVISYF